MEQRCDTVQKHWGEVGLEPQVLSHYLQTQALVSPIKLFSNLLYTTKNPSNTVDLPMDLLSSRPGNKCENRPITNFKSRVSANTTVTSKKLKFPPEPCFLLKFMRFTRYDLTQGFSNGALGPFGGHGTVLWVPGAEAFTR